jgi:DNA gyrase inhibitor GyrI
MKGPYKDMPQHFMEMHEAWLPSSDKVPDYSRPFLEIYLNNPNEVGMENALTDLCLPIREDRI